MAERQLALGATNQDGRLDVDLTDHVPLTPDDGGILVVGGEEVGEIDLTPIRRFHDEAAWVAASPDSCRKPENITACDGLHTYLLRFPHGSHAKETTETLEAATDRLESLAEEAEAKRREREGTTGGRPMGSGGWVRCRDGTLSPKCRCGGSLRGCCSRHGGVAGCE